MKKANAMIAAAMLAFAATAANPKFTWTGGAGPLSSGEWAGWYSWNDPANWDGAGVPVACGPSAGASGHFDFTAAARDARIVCDSGVNHCFGGIAFGGNQGTLEIVSAGTGCNIEWYGSLDFTVPGGTRVLWGLNKSTGRNEYFSTLRLNGGGELRITAKDVYSVYRQRVNVGAETTFGIDSAAGDFRTLVVDLQSPTAKFDLGCDTTIGTIMESNSGGQVVLNGHVLRLAMGNIPAYSFLPDGVTTNRFSVSGAGSIAYAGGRVFENANAQKFSGALVLENADVTADMGFPNASSIAIAGSGVLALGGGTSVSSLAGEGATGGIVLKEGATLEVNGSGSGSSVYRSRLSGAGTLVKAGDSELVLSGANTMTGPIAVNAGVLTVKGPQAPSESALHHGCSFEDSLADDAGTASVNLKYGYKNESGVSSEWDVPPAGAGPAVFCGGRKGTRGIEVASGSHATVKVDGGSTGIGRGPFTATMWMIPAADICRKDDNFGMTCLMFLGSGANSAYTSCKVYLSDTSVISYSVGGYTVKPVSQADGLGVDADIPHGTLYDGDWHMVTITYSGEETKILTGYFDGEPVGSKEISGGTVFLEGRLQLGYGQLGSLAGKFDDFKLLKRCQSAEEVKAEYMDAVADADDFSALPKPVAHWAFDDEENPGKDSSGNGYHLSAYSAGGASVADVPGAYGKALAKESPMALPAIPAKIPVGNAPWTVSARYMVDEVEQNADKNNPSVFFWGDNRGDTENFNNNGNKFLQLTAANASPSDADIYRIIRPALKYDNAKYCTLNERDFFSTTYNNMYRAGKANWVNLIVVWDPAAKTFSGYADGVLLGTVARNSMSISETGRLLVGLRPGYGNAGNNVEVPFRGYVDDIRIFDVALSAEQVHVLARGLESGTAGSPLPATSDVSVADGAELRVSGTGAAAKSISGNGTVNLEKGSSLAAGGGSAGVLCGRGQLTLTAPFRVADASAYWGNVVLAGSGSIEAPGYAGSVALPDPYAVSLDSESALPLVRTSGRVKFPDSGTIAFPSLPESISDTLVAEAANLVLPDDLSGWRIEPDNSCNLRSALSVRDGKVYLRRKPHKGLILVVR